MPQRASPLFLERRGYRMRRLMDAIRVLPVIGIGLWMIPLLWPDAQAADAVPVPMSRALLYVFAVWVGLILCSVLFWRILRRLPEDIEAADPGPGPR